MSPFVLNALSIFTFTLCITHQTNAMARKFWMDGNIDPSKTEISPTLIHQFLQYISFADDICDESDISLITRRLMDYSFSPANGSHPLDLNLTEIEKEIIAALYANAQQSCFALGLQPDCYEACISYNHPLSILALGVDNPYFKYYVYQILEWYGTGSSPVGWYDVGNPDQCEFFNGKYCFTPLVTPRGAKHQSIAMPHGCCIPSSCQGEDAVKVVSANGFCFKAFDAAYTQLLGNGTEIKAVCDPVPRDTTSFGFIFVVLIFFIFVCLVIIASIIYQLIIEYIAPQSGYNDLNNNNLKEQFNLDNDNQLPLQPTTVNNYDPVKDKTFLNIFSIQVIWNKFTSRRPKGKTDLNFLDGIRVYSMSWVILGHGFLFYLLSGGSNTSTLVPFYGAGPEGFQFLINKFYSIFIQYAFFSVDSFFWLSGLLGAFSLYRNLKRKYGDDIEKTVRSTYFWIPMAYLARYLRLVPMMMFVTAIQAQISDQLASGPHVMDRTVNNDNCSDNWLKILFLNANLYLTNDNSDALSCMGQLWYVQVDFQCYLLLPFLILLFLINKYIGIIASLIPFVICIIIRLYEGIYYQFSANVLIPAYPTKYGANQQNMSYYKPWTRMSVYFIGVTTMFIFILIDDISKQKNIKFKLNLGIA